MNKLTGVVGFTAICAALIAGAAFSAIRQPSPQVDAAIAEQEHAKAETLNAQADQARAAAADAWNTTEARRLAQPEIAAAARWWALGPAIAATILLVGAALAIVARLQLAARVVYPNADGLYPILIERKWGGAIVIADTSRQFSSIATIDAAGRICGPEPSEQTAARLATQAQAAGAMVGMARKDTAQAITERVKATAGALPVPQFARITPGSGEVVEDDGANFVYVKAPGTTKAQRDLQDVGEFIRDSWGPRGLARAAWLGQKFTGTGNKVSRGYYDELTRRLATAGVIVKDGERWKTAVELDEALDAFGLAHE
jgi:hypothetical protein